MKHTCFQNIIISKFPSLKIFSKFSGSTQWSWKYSTAIVFSILQNFMLNKLSGLNY